MLNGYDVIHEAFTKQADVFTDRPQLFAPLIGVSKGTGKESNAAWNMHKLLQSLLHAAHRGSAEDWIELQV